MPKWAWPVAVLLGLALISCHVESARAGTPEFELDQPFQVSGGQEAHNSAEQLHLTFTDVLEDSRCPTQVECFWTGQARIAISVQPEGSDATRVEFNTNPAPGQTVKEATVGRHRIELVALDPFPQTPDDPIEFDDYQATLVVRTRQPSI